MDNSHVALVSVQLEAAGFKRYRCDRPMPLGVNLGSLTKVLKCAKDDDECTLKAADEPDILNLVYEGKRELLYFIFWMTCRCPFVPYFAPLRLFLICFVNQCCNASHLRSLLHFSVFLTHPQTPIV